MMITSRRRKLNRLSHRGAPLTFISHETEKVFGIARFYSAIELNFKSF